MAEKRYDRERSRGKGKSFGLARFLVARDVQAVQAALHGFHPALEFKKRPFLELVALESGTTRITNRQFADGQGKAGVMSNLLRRRDIDARRAADSVPLPVVGITLERESARRRGGAILRLIVGDVPSKFYAEGHQVLGERRACTDVAGLSDAALDRQGRQASPHHMPRHAIMFGRLPLVLPDAALFSEPSKVDGMPDVIELQAIYPSEKDDYLR